jgi:CDP-glycerol glycerophosphotransferase
MSPTGPRWMRRRHDPTAPPAPSEEDKQRRLEPLLRAYEQQRQAPIDDNLTVFASYWYSSISCNPRAIYDKLGELMPDMRRVWVVNRRLARHMPAGIDFVQARTEEYFDVLARARWFVNNANFPNHYVKRDGTVHVQTHHGTPLKKMGADQFVGSDPRTDIDFDALVRRCARWDYSLSSNRWSTGVWQQAYPVDYESLEYGYPRNDRLFTATPDDVMHIRKSLGVDAGRKVVLFAPTHREYHDVYRPTVDVGRLVEALGDAFVLLVRLHYAYSEGPFADESGRVVDVSDHDSVEELFLAADVLVTDYSSAMFDYANLDRPIVVHAPDWDEYQARRGTYFDLLAEPPGVVTRTDDELADALRSGAVDDERARSLRAAFRAKFCDLDDGHAAERVVRRVWPA